MLIVPDLLLAQTPADAEKVDSSFIERILWSIVNGFFGVLVWLSGMLLNTAVTDYVVGFGNKFIDTGLGFAVNNLWTTVRDIFNLTFIFGLVYIGFKMILDSSDSNARKMLVHIILAALLVNFSLFFTKFIVDFSNIAATQIASSFNTGGTGNYLVADKFMNELGLSKIWGDNINLNNLASGNGNGLTYIFMTMIVFIVTAFVFFAGALLLMIRFVVLNLYMILSPVMFLGWVFPGMASYSQMWWSGFLGRAFFAPAYLLMLYFAATILTEFAALGNSSGLGAIFLDANVAKDEFVNSVPYFVMMCIFLIASIVVGQKMGADGANMAISFGKNMVGRARNSLVRGSTQILVKTGAAAAYLPAAGARMALNASGNSLQKKLNALQTENSRLGKLASTNAADRFLRGTTDSMKNAELGTGTTNQKEREYKQSTQARASQTQGENARKDNFDKINDTLANPISTTAELNTAIDDLAKVIKQMSSIEKERLGFDKLNTQNIATQLTDSDIENFEKTGKFSAQQIQDIKNTRNAGLMNTATHGNTFGTGIDPQTGAKTYSHANASTIDQRQSIFNKNIKDIGKLPVDLFKQPSLFSEITPAMLEERMRNGMKTSDRAEIRNALSTYLSIPNTAVPTSTTGPEAIWTKWANNTNSQFSTQFFA